MSKSKHNGVEPSQIFGKYGVDTSRLLILGDVAPTSDRLWKEEVHNRMVPFRLRFANHKTQREMVLSEMFSRPEEEIDQENTIVYSDSAYVKYIV
ncbi:unnamed protein product [Nesidiocoris tenuis]|uniref:Uncharacterized protein n=1 Tax=Nesidiocoris tenuis TaxID=355587 RepID=A0A6H5HIQ6_9HEMI|nr:unnamed protein product [Nesidiocoris tenuis]